MNNLWPVDPTPLGSLRPQLCHTWTSCWSHGSLISICGSHRVAGALSCSLFSPHPGYLWLCLLRHTCLSPSLFWHGKGEHDAQVGSPPNTHTHHIECCLSFLLFPPPPSSQCFLDSSPDKLPHPNLNQFLTSHT